MKIFFTEGAGFIGSNFIRYVLQSGSGHAIVNYDRRTYAGNLANFHPIADLPLPRFVRATFATLQL